MNSQLIILLTEALKERESNINRRQQESQPVDNQSQPQARPDYPRPTLPSRSDHPTITIPHDSYRQPGIGRSSACVTTVRERNWRELRDRPAGNIMRGCWAWVREEIRAGPPSVRARRGRGDCIRADP